ncbi:acyl-CoA dehydrogenase family protein [Sulfitobacter sp. F26169L]|uniref:acyl-CoA dehydrogenase family protein n=1 Tax=Sulfitobacter sp. F26169L TaxID=2996015 RepID=UPI002260FE04|nr:acyl-CoA dehydrogenase family protein [Sulfitobacter sp. F26169L]MCX7567962.1 acyl-CoA dehydrogenase family protein [Sulfitobacter sp. F26169L]
MDFNLTQEQTQLSDTLRRWIEKEYDFEARRAIIKSAEGVSADAWSGLAELGLMALPVPEAQDGFGASGSDMFAVMQELGKGLLVEPYLATVSGVQYLKQDAEKHAELLQQVAGGEARIACALGEAQSRYNRYDVAMTAKADGDGYILNGRKTVVVHGAQADHLIVSARTDGDPRDHSGISLFVMAADAKGITRSDYRTIDGMRAADINFADVRVQVASLIGAAGEAWPIIDVVSDYSCALICAEAVGIMQATYETTLEYLKTRRQFDQPIGAFQALQHRMVEMFIEVEQARSMAMLAAARIGSDDAEERRRTVSGAMIRVGQAANRVGEEAIQLHGGIGMTNEMQVAHYFKRLTMFGAVYGDVDHHINRFTHQPAFPQSA